MQIKLFSNTQLKYLEEQVNDFLNSSIKKIRIRQISHSECEEGFTVMIVYEPIMDMTE